MMKVFTLIKDDSPILKATPLPVVNENPEIWVASESAVINEDMDQIFPLDPEDKKLFYVQLSVAIGNCYKAIMQGDYPEYVAGTAVETPEEVYRFSRFLENSCPLDECLSKISDKEANLKKTNYDAFLKEQKLYINSCPVLLGGDIVQIDQDQYKRLVGLMSIYALCFFFDDGDYKPDNILLIEKSTHFDLIKIDPEITLGPLFFRQNQAEIEGAIITPLDSKFFSAFEEAIVGDQYGVSVHYPMIAAGLFETDDALSEFYQTLEKIIAYDPHEFANQIRSHIDKKFEVYINMIIDSFKKRQGYFQTVLQQNKLFQSETEKTTTGPVLFQKGERDNPPTNNSVSSKTNLIPTSKKMAKQ